MRTISQKQFNELNEYLEYDGVDEEFLTKLRDATGITAKPYVAYNLYDENGDYVGNSPVSFPKVVGTHTITLYKKGYLIKSYTIQATDDGKDMECKYAPLISLTDAINKSYGK